MPVSQNVAKKELAKKELNTSGSASSWNQLLKNNELSIYMVLKTVFFPTNSSGNICGGCWLIFEGEKGAILRHDFWATTKRNIGAACSTREPWQKFRNSLRNLGSKDTGLTERFITLVYTVLQDMDRVDLFEEAKEGRETNEGNVSNHSKLNSVEISIRRGLERVIRNILDVNCELEFISRKELEAEGILEPIVTEEPKDGEKSENKTDGASDSDASSGSENNAGNQEPSAKKETIINCSPFVEPISGIPCSELKPGDLLEISILGDTPTGSLIKKLLEASAEPLIFPIETIEVSNNRTKIFLRINEEIVGLVVLTKNLKLRTKKAEALAGAAASGDLIGIIVLCVIIAIILILFAYLAIVFIF